jgi:ribosomal protein S27AE
VVEKERANQIIQALSKKGVTKPCPRCGHPHFSVVAETSIPINYNPMIIGGDTSVVPTVIVACSNCGFVTQHALGALGIAPAEAAHAG